MFHLDIGHRSPLLQNVVVVHPLEGGGSVTGCKSCFRPEAGKMSPAPSVLQAVDGLTIYTEVFVLALVLISNVLGNNFIGYIPKSATEIAARPQVPSQKLLLPVRKFRQQMMACFARQPLQQSADPSCGGIERNKCT